MILDIVKGDVNILTKKSEPIRDKVLAESLSKNLLETALAHNGLDGGKVACGLSAVQVNKHYRIAVINVNREGIEPFVICNPVIVGKSGVFETEEECMSLEGSRKVTRYAKINLFYYSPNNLNRVIKKSFRGYTAQIIQHEIDHFNGKLI